MNNNQPQAARPTANPFTADPSTADPSTADPFTADPSTADPSTADPSTADPFTADPFTGGDPISGKDDHSIWIEIVDTPIDIASLRAKVSHPDAGAIGWFEGVTRRTTGDRTTQSLAYEAHRPMALAQLRRLASEAVEKFGLRHCVLVHRLGQVPIGEASVVVGCSSSHRPATFAALPWIMNALKKDVPIWKQEQYADGTTEWVHPVDE